ncbi:MAG: hypothetical protein ACRDPA_22940, partial [Solirubrobacteraceae bacterium]
MRRAVRGLACTVVVVVASVALTAGATATSATGHCHGYKGGAAGLVDTFTRITASGVSCGRAHEVLGTWANSGPGGTDLGFSCHAHRAMTKDTFQIRCVQAG